MTTTTTTTSQRQSTLLAVTAVFVSMMLLLLPQASAAAAFVGVPPWMISSSSSSSSSRCMAKRRGNLGKVVQDGVVAAGNNRKTKANKQKSPLRRQTAADGTVGNISPDLAKWIATQSPPANDNSSSSSSAAAAAAAVESSLWQQPVVNDDTTGSDNVAPAFVSFTKTTKASSSRRERQGERMAAEQARQQQIQTHIQQLEQVLGLTTTTTTSSGDSTTKKSASLTDILAPIRQLIRCGDRSSSSLQQLLLSSKQQQQQQLDYRLAWVGSDAAVSHVGTGLHKVPLARLQEVFLSFSGRGGRVTWQEVIRILGPFPNVKNTLAGTAQSVMIPIMTTRMNSSSNRNKKQNKDSDTTDTDNTKKDTTTGTVVGSDWRITWDSMVDGTGKEILAGTAANKRMVDLHMYLADPAVLIAAVPPPAGSTTNPMDDDTGAQMLVFLREDDLKEKLERLRVA